MGIPCRPVIGRFDHLFLNRCFDWSILEHFIFPVSCLGIFGFRKSFFPPPNQTWPFPENMIIN